MSVLEDIDSWAERLQIAGPLAPMLSRSEAAHLLGVCKATIINWEKAGKLAPIRLSPTTVRIPREQVARLMQGQGYVYKAS